MHQEGHEQPTSSVSDIEDVLLNSWNDEFDTNQTISNSFTTESHRLLKVSFTDKLIALVCKLLSLYLSLFGVFFRVSYLAINSVLCITLLGLKYGYTLDNIRALIGQARLETGEFSSTMAKDDNNLFGMHYPYSRDTYSTDSRYNASEYSQVSRYPDIASSVLDRFIWDNQWIAFPVKPKQEQSLYMNNVNENYGASDPDYWIKWQSMTFSDKAQFQRVCYTIIAGLLPLLYFLLKKLK